MRFLAVPGAPVQTTVLGGCAHLVRVPRCQRRHWGGRSERAAERNRILEFSSKISFNTLKYYEPDFGLPRVYPNVAHFLHELSCQTGREPTAGLLVRYSTVQYKYTLKIFPHLRVPWHSVPGYTSTRTCTN